LGSEVRRGFLKKVSKERNILSSQSSDLYFEENYEYEDYEQEGEPSELQVKILVFRVGDETYAVRMIDMQEVLTMHEITVIPRAPRHLMGITSLRGKVIPVIDLRTRLRIEATDATNPRILVLSGEGQPIGIKVDSIIGKFIIKQDEMMPAPNTLNDEASRFIDVVIRVEQRFVSILNLGEVLKI